MNGGGVVSPDGGDGSVDLSGLPDNALPWMAAAAKYSSLTLAAMFFSGDWSEAEEAYAEMLQEQTRWTGAAVAASSKAASELDYFGSVSGVQPTEAGEKQ